MTQSFKQRSAHAIALITLEEMGILPDRTKSLRSQCMQLCQVENVTAGQDSKSD